MPDPDSTATAKLYSTEFYGLVRRAMTDDARVVVQAGSPYFAPKAFWAIEATMQAAGLGTTPYQASVPSFGEWGFHLGAAGPARELRLPADAPPLRSLDPPTLAAAAAFPPDRARISGLTPSTLLHPTILSYVQDEWRNY